MLAPNQSPKLARAPMPNVPSVLNAVTIGPTHTGVSRHGGLSPANAASSREGGSLTGAGAGAGKAAAAASGGGAGSGSGSGGAGCTGGGVVLLSAAAAGTPM